MFALPASLGFVGPKSIYDLYAWGLRGAGVQGDNVTSPSTTSPVLKVSDLDFTHIDCYQSSAYVDSNHNGFVTGLNTSGQLGLSDTTAHNAWVQLSGSNWQKILFGPSFGIALKTDGSVWHAGSKSGSKDGNGGTTGNNTAWTQIGSSTDNVDIAVGSAHVVLLKSNGDIATFGLNTNGQCCLGHTTSPVTSPTTVSGVNAGFIEACSTATFVIKSTDSKLYTAGNANQNGHGSSKTSLTILNSDLYLKVITSSSSSSTGIFAIRTSNVVDCWGSNGQSQLGDGTTTLRSTPITFNSGNLYTDIATGIIGSGATVGIRTDGTMWGCGNYQGNGLGQASGNQSTPAQIGSYSDWAGVSGRGLTFFAWK